MSSPEDIARAAAAAAAAELIEPGMTLGLGSGRAVWRVIEEITRRFGPTPPLRGVFASNLIMSQGVGQAIAENKAGDTIKVIGFDSDDKLVKLLADGHLAAIVVQDPFRMGYDGIKTALAASKGEKVPENVDTGVNLITKENMNSERSKELLTPSVK